MSTGAHFLFLFALAFIFIAAVVCAMYLRPRGRGAETAQGYSERKRDAERTRRDAETPL
jgi:hypothetical protein